MPPGITGTRATRVEKLDLDRSKLFWKVALVLAFCVIAEDTYMILLCRPDSQNPVISLFLWYLSERQYLRKRAARGMRGPTLLPV